MTEEDEQRLIDAVVATLTGNFSHAEVDGVVIRESQARLLAVEVLRRYLGPETSRKD